MNEAARSVNVKFQLDGFDCQATLRTDDPSHPLIHELLGLIQDLKTFGAVPTVRNGTGKSDRGAQKLEAPVCEECKRSDEMELIRFKKNGESREAWKCQRCNKWVK